MVRGSYLYCVLERYTRWSWAWQWNWQLTYGILDSRLIQNTPVWHISKNADKRIPRCRIVLHGARRWGLLILEISLIISGPSSIPIVVTAVRCPRRDRSWQKTHCHNILSISSILYRIRYRILCSIQIRIRCRIRYLEYFIQSCYTVYC
jgi:hypothetical protein